MAGDHCPVFGHKFVWGRSGLGKGKTTGDSPSLDRIVPELGYIPENVVFISHNANRIKNNATEKELYLVADWLHEARKKVNAQTNTTTPVPAGDYQQGEDHFLDGFVLATGPRKNDDDAQHHCGTIHWEDVNHSTQESSGDSVGRGGEEVATPLTFEGVENYGLSNAKIIWIRDRRGRLPNKP